MTMSASKLSDARGARTGITRHWARLGAATVDVRHGATQVQEEGTPGVRRPEGPHQELGARRQGAMRGRHEVGAKSRCQILSVGITQVLFALDGP
ncbi:unnamed protein product [Ilex paraguariensis]|uniref:Uncharacterized protein n=1 Tax=Ilex paraguariensis TaxID=185542 RepID=A0ABC8UJ16_9AQUA